MFHSLSTGATLSRSSRRTLSCAAVVLVVEARERHAGDALDLATSLVNQAINCVRESLLQIIKTRCSVNVQTATTVINLFLRPEHCYINAGFPPF